ncbi:MAG TPA: class I SAM-dependent methyltransferase [Solirubrobacteraceae bacterium]|jgi:predicted O-methyltransferase YrrM|nr:class I SAM-dependent methyltransferase [Solirubrobacteraceae bacterium]
MRPERRAIADEVFAAGSEYDAGQSNRLDRLRNVEPETAELLGVLVRAAHARRILEIGTSNGHSTLWLADAAEAVGGHVETLDIDPRRTELALLNLRRAGLDEIVECRTVGAAQALAEYPDAAWDLVFLDAERPEYVGYWPNLRRTLAPSGTIAIDNAISHSAELTDLQRVLDADDALTSALVGVGAGLILVVAA